MFKNMLIIITKKLLGLFSCVVFMSSLTLTAQAKIFKNAYVSFELPDAWECVLEHTEWVCRSKVDKDSKEAIIILTAKEVGPGDSFASYTSHLEKPMNVSVRTVGIPSKIIYAPKQVKLNDHPWVDGLHLASEVPNYFTRYLATIKEKIAVLVTFSAHKDQYTKYSQDFFKAVQSLRVVAAKNLLAGNDSMSTGQDLLGGNISAAIPNDMAGTEPTTGTGTKDNGAKTKAILFIIAVLLAAGALFVIMKLKKK